MGWPKKTLPRIAKTMGVTVEHLEFIKRQRQIYKNALFFRRRSRRRQLAVNPEARKIPHAVHQIRAGEGEFHASLRMVGMSLPQFAEMVGMSIQAVRHWNGWPLYSWPRELLRMYGWSQAMAKRLRELGQDPDKYLPQMPTQRTTTGKYPKKKGEVVLAADPEYSPWKRQA